MKFWAFGNSFLEIQFNFVIKLTKKYKNELTKLTAKMFEKSEVIEVNPEFWFFGKFSKYY